MINIEIIKSKKLTFIILILYFYYGISKIIFNNNLSHSYIVLSFFMFFKIICNYYQCTISYFNNYNIIYIKNY